ncbi:MAG: hypothetical protein NC320_10820 [Clostridium sp.]|nr:hypothetical protein [Clostridium sp.]
MNMLDKEFVEKVLDKYKQFRHIDDDDKNNLSMMLAKVSADIFTPAFNTLIKYNYFQEDQNELPKQER